MNDHNKLKVEYPFLRGLPDHAFFLSAMGEQELTDKWIANQYIHITCNENFIERNVLGFDFYLDYKRCPYLEISYLPNCVVQKDRNSIWNLICKLIDNQYYIALGLDENIIPNRQYFGCGIPRYHNHFIYGYKEDGIYVGCFNKVGKYIFDYIDKSLFFDALLLSEERKLQVVRRTENKRYELNLDFIIRSLTDYIDGVDLPKKYDFIIPDQVSDWKAFGWKVYPYLIEYYSTLHKTGMEIDFRPVFMMVEHQKCMVKRIELIGQKFDISLSDESQAFINLQRELDVALKYILKYTLSKNMNALDNAVSKLESCMIQEKRAYDSLIVCLERI